MILERFVFVFCLVSSFSRSPDDDRVPTQPGILEKYVNFEMSVPNQQKSGNQ